MGAKRRKSKKQSITSEHYQRRLKRTTFYLERSLGGRIIREKLREAGLKVESHHVRFRHNTPDEIWLDVVGEKKWIVLMRDLSIGKRLLELDALLDARVKAFALISGELTDADGAAIFIKAVPRMLDMVDEHQFPFIAKVQRDSTVELWKTHPMIHKGIQKKKRRNK